MPAGPAPERRCSQRPRGPVHRNARWSATCQPIVFASIIADRSLRRAVENVNEHAGLLFPQVTTSAKTDEFAPETSASVQFPQSIRNSRSSLQVFGIGVQVPVA